MARVFEVVVILLVPTLAFAGLLLTVRVTRSLGELVRRYRWREHPAVPPIERIAADLRRLRRDLTRVELAADGTPGRSVRLRALRSAYAESLELACRALEVPVGDGDLARLPVAEVYRIEAVLCSRGLDVYSTALH